MAPNSTMPLSSRQNNTSTTVYLTRHGESNNNLYGRIGGDADLSSRGRQYAKELGSFVKDLKLPSVEVWVTQYRRTQQTAQHLDYPRIVTPELGEIQAGDHDGLTYEEIADRFPVEFARRDSDKLQYRYPGGESYLDVVERIQPLVDRIRSQDNLIIISHQATLRCVLSLLMGTSLTDLPYMKIPLHTVLQVTMSGDKVTLDQHRLAVDCVDTHRARPTNCMVDRPKEEACHTVPTHL